jgi:hypothetical protein
MSVADGVKPNLCNRPPVACSIAHWRSSMKYEAKVETNITLQLTYKELGIINDALHHFRYCSTRNMSNTYASLDEEKRGLLDELQEETSKIHFVIKGEMGL